MAPSTHPTSRPPPSTTTTNDDWEYEYTTTANPTTHYIPIHLPPRQSSTSSLSQSGTAQLLTTHTDNPLLALDGRLYVIQPTESIGSYMFVDKHTGEVVATGREGGVAKAAVVREGGRGEGGKSGARRWKEKFGEARKRRAEKELEKEKEKGEEQAGEKEQNGGDREGDGDAMEGVEREG